MNNTQVESIIQDAIREFSQLEILVGQVGSTSPMSKYLTKYALIKACGTIEYAFKNIIADYHNQASPQIRKFIDIMVRESSQNPSLDNIRSTLKKFDTVWIDNFNNRLKTHTNKDKLTTSLSSLNNERNAFAHGGNCSATFQNIKDYFTDSLEIIYILDMIVV